MLQHRMRSAKVFFKVWNRITVPCACLHDNFRQERSESLYEVLGVPVHASDKEIKDAFKDLSKKFHPDVDTNDKTLHEKFVKISEAYTVLSNPSQREVYDEGLKAGSQGHDRVYSTHNPNQNQEFYEHPNYYKDPEMRKKAIEYWQTKTGFSQADSKEGGEFNATEERSARRIAQVTILISLVLSIVFYQFLKSQFHVEDKRTRRDKINVFPKPRPGERKAPMIEPDISVERDYTEKAMAGPVAYYDQREMKT